MVEDGGHQVGAQNLVQHAASPVSLSVTPLAVDEATGVGENSLAVVDFVDLKISLVHGVSISTEIVRLEIGRGVGVVIAASTDVDCVPTVIISQLEHDVAVLVALDNDSVASALEKQTSATHESQGT